jgi:hypothetical protein
MAYLDDHPPARSQFRCPRRAQESGVVVVHTTEQSPDTSGVDGGAEANARFTASRTDKAGSYHNVADSQNWINLVRYECEAFHDATGTNPHSFGVSFATQADLWDRLPADYVTRMLQQGAAATRHYAAWLRIRRGITIPARRITVAQARNGVPGFVGHGELDPARRTDPTGPRKVFPWDRFLSYFDGGEDDMTPAECEAAVRKVLNEGTAIGTDNWADTNKTILQVARSTYNRVGAVGAAVNQVDEATVAALTEAIQDAGGTVTGEVVEAAVRRVFADAAVPDA